MALLEVSNLGIAFGGLQAVAQFDLTIEKGHLYGLIGPNGAGKTTVFNMLTGMYRPTEGNIVLDGKDITGKSPELINKAGIARTFQNIRLFNEMTVLDNVKVGMHNQVPYGMWTGILRLPAYWEKEHEMDRQAHKLLKIFDLDGEAELKASQLPYGKQRKLEIARALATDPKLLLLDEPAAGMNPNETGELMETIDYSIDKGYTVMWASDVSEKGFQYLKGFAVVPVEKKNDNLSGTELSRWVKLSKAEKEGELYKFEEPEEEMVIDQKVRQEAFDNYETTDDHGMVFVGTAVDQNGTKYYKVKNSWGTEQVYGGFFYASEAFVKYKTMDILVHKDAVPAKILKKLHLQ